MDNLIDESLSKVMRDVFEPLQGKVVTMGQEQLNKNLWKNKQISR